jgi:hypothetical protein
MAGFEVTLYGRFWVTPKVVIALLTGVWCTFCWLNSDHLREKRRTLEARISKVDEHRQLSVRYYWVKSMVALFILGVTGYFVVLAYRAKLQFEQEDVFNNLAMEVRVPLGTEDEPTEATFTVRNNGHFAVSGRHQLSCKVNVALLNNRPLLSNSAYSKRALGGGLFLVSGSPFLPDRDSGITIRSGGDALSEDCLAWVVTKQMNCLDATMAFTYYLSTQPRALQTKQWRWVAKQGPTGKSEWAQQPIDGAGDNGCFILVDDRHPLPH